MGNFGCIVMDPEEEKERERRSGKKNFPRRRPGKGDVGWADESVVREAAAAAEVPSEQGADEDVLLQAWDWLQVRASH